MLVDTKDRSCGPPSLLFSVVVVLDADPAEQRVQMIGHVSSREHVGDAGAARGIDQDAVVECDAAAFKKLDVRLNPNGHDGEVTFEGAAGPRDGALDFAPALESHDLVVRKQLYPVVGMN